MSHVKVFSAIWHKCCGNTSKSVYFSGKTRFKTEIVAAGFHWSVRLRKTSQTDFVMGSGKNFVFTRGRKPPRQNELDSSSRLIEYQLVTDGQTDRQTHDDSIASPGNKVNAAVTSQEIKLKDFKELLRASINSPGLHCCSEWFEQVSSGNVEYLADGGFSSRSEPVHGLWNGQCVRV